MKKLAIVILNWNGVEMMRQYLPTVIANSVGDVIVADNASTDGSVEMLLKEFQEQEYTLSPTLLFSKRQQYMITTF